MNITTGVAMFSGTQISRVICNKAHDSLPCINAQCYLNEEK